LQPERNIWYNKENHFGIDIEV